jgi:uncharacterized protein
MLINVLSISKEIGATLEVDFNEELPPVVIAGETLGFKGPVSAQGKVTSTGSTFIVSTTIKALAELNCSLCLKPFTYEISTTMEEEYCRASDVNAAEEDGIAPDELILFTGDEIKIEEEVVDSIVMAMPMKPICHAYCKGLCSICGKNKEQETCDCQVDDVDPRFEILKKLKI